MGVAQAELAKKLFITQSKLSRIEDGQAEFSILEFKTAFSLLGHPTDDLWLAFLTVEEFEAYLQYREIKQVLALGRDVGNARDACLSFIESSLAKRPFFSPIVAVVKVRLDEEMPEEQKLATLNAAFGKNAELHSLTQDQTIVANEIALTHARLGQRHKAIALLDGVVHNLDNSRMTLPEQYDTVPKISADFVTLLVEDQQYEKAAKVCENVRAARHCRYRAQFNSVIAYALGVCYHKMNKDKQEYMYWLTAAYHTAKAVGQNDLASKIAKEYGIQ